MSDSPRSLGLLLSSLSISTRPLHEMATNPGQRPPSSILPGRLRPTTAMEFTFSREHHKVVLGSGNNRERAKDIDRRPSDRRTDGKGRRGRAGATSSQTARPQSYNSLPSLFSSPSPTLSESLVAYVGWLAGWRVRLGGSHSTWGVQPAGR